MTSASQIQLLQALFDTDHSAAIFSELWLVQNKPVTFCHSSNFIWLLFKVYFLLPNSYFCLLCTKISQTFLLPSLDVTKRVEVYQQSRRSASAPALSSWKPQLPEKPNFALVALSSKKIMFLLPVGEKHALMRIVSLLGKNRPIRHWKVISMEGMQIRIFSRLGQILSWFSQGSERKPS